MKSETLPIGLRLSGRRALVVGEGAEAETRVRALLAAGAAVRLVGTAPPEPLRAVSMVEILERAFEDGDVEGCLLVVLARRDAALASRIDALATARPFLFCAVDQPSFGNFSHLAIARAGDVTVAISTNGRAPALARRLREELARLFAESALAPFSEGLAALRERTPSADRARVLGEAVRAVRLTGKLETPK